MAQALIEDPETWALAGDLLAPAEHLLPSEWAARYRVLKEGTTDQPGRWSNDYLPWLRPIMDVRELEPWRQGDVFMKCGQSGGSERGMNNLGCGVCQRPGPVLYLTSTDDQAKEFSRDRLVPMIEGASVLKARQLRDPGNRDLMHVKRFAGAKVAMWGSGSPNKLMSEPYQTVYLDEVDRLPTFPGVGSAWALAEIRTRRFRNSWISAWSTPTLPDAGIADKWERLSDQRRFFIECPHCGDSMFLIWGQVRIEDRRAETARYECGLCGEAITDLQRSRAVFRGEYRTTLEDAEEARRRPYAGFHISRLYDPYLPLSSLAATYLSCASESALQVFHNSDLGEPYRPSSLPLSEADIEARMGRHLNEPAPEDTQFITAGIDVQHGVNCYVDVSGWTSNGVKHLLWYGVVRGWERLRGWMREWNIEVGGQKRSMGIRLAAIDCGYLTTDVYAFCQSMGLDQCIPAKYDTVSGGEFWKRIIVKTMQPPIYRWNMRRTYWMDRAIGRFGGSDELASLVLPVGISDEYKSHILANSRIVAIDSYGNERVTWDKGKGKDDYLQAAVNAEFAAVMCGLERLQAEAETIKRARKVLRERAQEVSEGWIRRGYQKHRGKWIR